MRQEVLKHWKGFSYSLKSPLGYFSSSYVVLLPLLNPPVHQPDGILKMVQSLLVKKKNKKLNCRRGVRENN